MGATIRGPEFVLSLGWLNVVVSGNKWGWHTGSRSQTRHRPRGRVESERRRGGAGDRGGSGRERARHGEVNWWETHAIVMIVPSLSRVMMMRAMTGRLKYLFHRSTHIAPSHAHPGTSPAAPGASSGNAPVAFV